ncbi:hypothetical protein DDIC_01905 [Desulfovibrio desulfuricans]|uniref:Uncharacterized protein n=1 Tax=Desulfovibrio desulfuricans TaxID=876 RepID=A0A4P7UIR5_DESDE|nr:DUF5665 domain-containing protein [Desulfovibrio desulfuricans]QCC84654.1 hypothetical protein DDIC_01905 [Desulfovibrio desulfuricans]
MDTQYEEKQAQAELLLQRLDNAGLAEYVKLSQKTGKILWLNFLSGIARGLGFSIGATLVLAVVYKILARIISMNIPYLTELLQQVMSIAKGG